ncbi:hypothetical protein HK099_000931, partial [Clydaea vesicula]
LFIGESPNITIGNIEVEDVCTNLYENISEKPTGWKESVELLQKEIKEDKIPTPGEKTEGWKMDAHKNLPGFVQLYNKIPEADWYIMLDDDTYMFFGNLDVLLKKYNPNHDHYFGTGTLFNGCDGVTKFGEGPEFAHGGSGIVISRSAMKKMVKNSKKCIKQYRDCWAGDVRTSLCLRDQGILLKSLPGFNNFTPDKFTFNIYDKKNEYELDLNRKGNDFKNLYCSTANLCQKICTEHQSCVAWTFEDQRCWLKDGIPEGEFSIGSISGVLFKKYSCEAV